MKDLRLVINSERVEGFDNVWTFDGKIDRAAKTLRVYRVYGDVVTRTPTGLFHYEVAIRQWAKDRGLKIRQRAVREKKGAK